MESSEPNPLQEESLASIRRKNTLLIAVLFSFIVSLSLIIGGFIIYLGFNQNSPSAITYLAVDEFCYVAESRSSCVAFLSSSNIKPILTKPIHVYKHSLESAVEGLSRIDSVLPNNCSTSLRTATVRIDKALAVMRVDLENDTRILEQRGGMVELIVEAMEELRSCSESTAVGEAARTRVQGIQLLLRYSRDYLLNCDLVNRRFHVQVMIDQVMPNNRILRPMAGFWLQYFVMVFLFVLILLRCNFCYIGGCCHRV